MKEAAQSGIQVIKRAASVLRALQEEPQGLSLGELARRAGLPRSTIQRIVNALVDEHFLIPASAQSRVRLGPGLVALGIAADIGTTTLLGPLMRQISNAIDETVDLSILKNQNAVFVAQVQGTQRLVAVSAVGKAFPLHCTANGKALLSLLPLPLRTRLLSGRLKRYTASTNVNKEDVEEELQEVARIGFAIDLEEHAAGICAMGIAFRDSIGREHALSIPVPTARFNYKRPMITKLLLKTRETILTQMSPTAPSA